jgi:AcrR family transcriptional regulator
VPKPSRRDRLLDAAAKVFSRRGVTDATVAELTEQAGIAKGSFYLEFETKEHCVAALQERYVDELLSKANGLFARIGADDLWSLTDEFITTIIDFELANSALAGVLAYDAPVPGPSPLSKADGRLQEMIAAGIRIGVAAGDFSTADPDLVAGLLMHGVHGLVRQAILEGNADRDRLVAAVSELTSRALGRDGGR